MPFRGDDGIFEEDFIEERRKGLESFINKYVGEWTVIILQKELSVLMKIDVSELPDIPWPRTSAAFTCFYTNPSLIKLTFQAKFEALLK